MAGIGWRLERLIGGGSLAGAAAAYATGAAVMALPWVLTTAVLVSLPAVMGRGLTDFRTAETVVNVAYSIALLVDGPLQIVVSRYTADRLYDGRLQAIAAPLCRALSATFLICAVTAATTLVALDLPILVALLGGALSGAVGAQWTALSVGNGLCTPGLVLGAVSAGAVQSFLLASVLVAVTHLGVPGYLFGLASGQSLTLAILLVGVFRALPEDTDEGARILPAFRDYAALAGAGLAFNASLWVDRLVAWRVVGGDAGAMHAMASTVAWFSAIPCLAWIFVQVETAFHRRFRAFFSALEGGASLAELRQASQALAGEAARLLRGAIAVQAGVVIVLELAAVPWIRLLGLPDAAVVPFRLLLLASGVQAVTLLGLILLYYFDARREALFAASSLCCGIAAFTLASAFLGLPPGAGTMLGCSLGCAVTWHLVFHEAHAVLQHTLLGQPMGAERIA